MCAARCTQPKPWRDRRPERRPCRQRPLDQAPRSRASSRREPPFARRPPQARGDRRQPAVQLQPRRLQRRPPVVGQRAAHRRAVPADHLGLGSSRPSTARSIGRTPADLLLQLLLGVPVGLVDRPGRLPQVVELAQLVRHPRQHLGHRLADRVLAVGDDPGDRHRARGAAPRAAARPGPAAGADSRLLASRISPERQSRTTHSTSCPTSGCRPSMARITRPCPASTRSAAGRRRPGRRRAVRRSGRAGW